MSTVDLGSKSGSISSSIAKLFEVLRTPDLTAQNVEDFSSTNDGYAAWSNLASAPDIVTLPPILNKIHQSVCAHIAIQRNTALFAQFSPWDTSTLIDTTRAKEIALFNDADFESWLISEQDTVGLLELSLSAQSIAVIVSDTEKIAALAQSNWAMTVFALSAVAMPVIAENQQVMTLIAASDIAMQLIVNSDVAMPIIADSSIAMREISLSNLAMQLISTTESALRIVVASSVSMTEIAESEIALIAVFSTTTNRTILFDVGAKQAADILMRNSVYALQWMKDNVAVSYTANGAGHGRTLDKKCYSISQSCSNNHSVNYQQTGLGVGDYHSGEWTMSGGTSTAVRAINERVSALYQNVAYSASWTTTAVYVIMS